MRACLAPHRPRARGRPGLFGLALLGALVASSAAFAQDGEAAPQAPDADAPDKELEEAGEEKSIEADDTSTGASLRERIRAVSNPVFKKAGRFEASPLLGVSANDAFFARLQVGARASFHIFEWLSVDAGGAFNYFSVPLPSVRVLQEQQIQVDDPLVTYLGHADVSAVFSPIYAKAALMSELVLHFDAYATAGAGATFDLTSFPVHPALAVGAGARAFVNDWLVVRAELRNYTYSVDPTRDLLEFGNLLFVNVGVGFFFPFSFERDQVTTGGAG